MCVQKPVKETLLEDYITGLFTVKEDFDEETEYYKYKDKLNSILPYQVGVWVTSYAFRNLFELGACVKNDMENDNGGLWLYSDTDSCYSINWDIEKINQYNNKCIQKLKDRGYPGVEHNGKMYYLGVAETSGDEDIYTEFRYQGAKRYCGRTIVSTMYGELLFCLFKLKWDLITHELIVLIKKISDNFKLKITVAGVPKKTGAKCLHNDIENFSPGLIFSGSITGKTTHYFIFKEEIENINGNEVGDSLDLCPCDYLLSSVYRPSWDDITKVVLYNYEYDKVL